MTKCCDPTCLPYACKVPLLDVLPYALDLSVDCSNSDSRSLYACTLYVTGMEECWGTSICMTSSFDVLSYPTPLPSELRVSVSGMTLMPTVLILYLTHYGSFSCSQRAIAWSHCHNHWKTIKDLALRSTLSTMLRTRDKSCVIAHVMPTRLQK